MVHTRYVVCELELQRVAKEDMMMYNDPTVNHT